jgi:hypothetical protein
MTIKIETTDLEGRGGTWTPLCRRPPRRYSRWRTEAASGRSPRMDASTATTIRSSRPSTPSRWRRTPPWRAAVQPTSCSAENDRGKRLPARPERLELFRRIARECQTANPEALRERTHTNHGKGLRKLSNIYSRPPGPGPHCVLFLVIRRAGRFSCWSRSLGLSTAPSFSLIRAAPLFYANRCSPSCETARPLGSGRA